MTLDDVAEDDPLREHLQIVLKAGLRGKDLVKQILTISHQADQERQPVQVEKIVSECLLLLRASLPTTIEIRKVIAANLGPVPADPSQQNTITTTQLATIATIPIWLAAPQPSPAMT
jgi:signal transduction histidine kinase